MKNMQFLRSNAFVKSNFIKNGLFAIIVDVIVKIRLQCSFKEQFHEIGYEKLTLKFIM